MDSAHSFKACDAVNKLPHDQRLDEVLDDVLTAYFKTNSVVGGRFMAVVVRIKNGKNARINYDNWFKNL